MDDGAQQEKVGGWRGKRAMHDEQLQHDVHDQRYSGLAASGWTLTAGAGAAAAVAVRFP